MPGYIGKPLVFPIFDYGEPITAYDMDDGTRAFVWSMRESGAIPGQAITTWSAAVAAYGDQANASMYATTVMTSPTTHLYDCNYTLIAKRVREDISGPIAWQVVNYHSPRMKCE